MIMTTAQVTLKGFKLEIDTQDADFNQVGAALYTYEDRQKADPAGLESIKTGACRGNAIKFTLLDQGEKASTALRDTSALQQLLGKTKTHLHNYGMLPVFDIVTVPQQGVRPQDETNFSTNSARD